MRRAAAIAALLLATAGLTACNDRDCNAAAPNDAVIATAAFAAKPFIPAPRPPVIPRPAPARPYRPGTVNPNPRPQYDTWHGTPQVPLLPFLLMRDCRR